MAEKTTDEKKPPQIVLPDGGAPPAADPALTGPAVAPVAPKTYCASIYPGPKVPLPEPLGSTLKQLETTLGKPLWMIIQAHDGPFAHIDGRLYDAFHAAKPELVRDEPVALLVHSPGGSARDAYEIARLLQRRCGGFSAVVPRAAMSAATLLVLGAQNILNGHDAVLGPLDAQLYDPDTEIYASVLNEVQALERLRAYALESVHETLMLLFDLTGKKIDTLLPQVLHFVSETSRPLLEKIDVVHYTERSRILKVAEEYAVRLLRPKHPEPRGHEAQDVARRIASHFVEKYPEHDFPIDMDEAIKIGLDVEKPTAEQDALLEALWTEVSGRTVIGRIEEVTGNA